VRSRSLAIVINPISGTGGRIDVARERAERAAMLVAARGVDAEIFVTDRPGHARELTTAALDRGVTTVVAWGGDGTVNEVASVLAFRDATLAIVPSGSGNGLASELMVSRDPERAFETAISGRVCRIDAGELDRHLFFNIAGIGIDASVAHRFAADGLVRRGFYRYLAIAAKELFTYKPQSHTVMADGITVRADAMLIAIANSRQYGNGALVAPKARLTDGRLDVVVIEPRSPFAAMLDAPLMFRGQIAKVRGVTELQARNIELTGEGPTAYHIDGEPFAGGASIAARSRPDALQVMVPAEARPIVLSYSVREDDQIVDCSGHSPGADVVA
jgi:YegS/Rv2252/BmrU family lipid kinase